MELVTPTLAMHMANELLSVPIAAVTLLAAAACVIVAASRAEKTLNPERMPLMGVMGAFVFAAQMINFTLPVMPGTSGHLGGGVLLAIVLGPAAAIVTITAILAVQCLLFQDGGLLALGCNIINMGVVPCLVGWGIYRVLLGPVERAGQWRQYLAAWAACLVGVTAGAALVPLEAMVSGVLLISTAHFLGVMVGVHLIIAFVEGLITFAVVAYLRQVRPAVLGLTAADDPSQRLGRKAVAASLVITSVLVAGVVAWFASGYPDGLEWSYLEHRYGDREESVAEPAPTIAAVGEWQSKYSPLSDYTRREAPLGEVAAEIEEDEEGESTWPAVDVWGSLAGILGTAVTLALVYGIARLLRRRRPLPARP